MKINARYLVFASAAIASALFISYSGADPGHGRALGHSNMGSTVGNIVPRGVTGISPVLGDSTSASLAKSSDFFVAPQKQPATQAATTQTLSQKNEAAQFITAAASQVSTTAANQLVSNNTSTATGTSNTLATQPDWWMNAASNRTAKPATSATPSPAPVSSATPFHLQLMQPSINPVPGP